jgi:hypothetical protein
MLVEAIFKFLFFWIKIMIRFWITFLPFHLVEYLRENTPIINRMNWSNTDIITDVYITIVLILMFGSMIIIGYHILYKPFMKFLKKGPSQFISFSEEE